MTNGGGCYLLFCQFNNGYGGYNTVGVEIKMLQYYEVNLLFGEINVKDYNKVIVILYNLRVNIRMVCLEIHWYESLTFEFLTVQYNI